MPAGRQASGAQQDFLDERHWASASTSQDNVAILAERVTEGARPGGKSP